MRMFNVVHRLLNRKNTAPEQVLITPTYPFGADELDKREIVVTSELDGRISISFYRKDGSGERLLDWKIVDRGGVFSTAFEEANRLPEFPVPVRPVKFVVLADDGFPIRLDAEIHEAALYYKVRLNGEYVERAKRADREKGEVEVYVEDGQTKVLKGTVTFERNHDPLVKTVKEQDDNADRKVE